MKITDRVRGKIALLAEIVSRIHKIQEALGRIESRQLIDKFDGDIRSVEFRAFSQWGEDGIIQALIRTLNIRCKIFVEFGVQDYTESNTRFLLIDNNWKGLVIDGSVKNINYIKNDPIYWQYNLKADCRFITCDNINTIITSNGITGEIGLLSVDIDGNDYWVWKAIDVINPAIVVTEYNARFGVDVAVTFPYDPEFVRSQKHYSNLYWGASLKAFWLLGKEKGYAFVGCNSAGNNAFFVRKELLTGPLREISVADGFVMSQFCDARDKEGNLSDLTPEQAVSLLATLPVVDVG